MPDSRPPVTRERIALVTLGIVDEEGTAAVTMRRVATELGIRAPSLYAHVQGRDEILALVHETVMREVGAFESSGDWRADLKSYYSRMHAVLVAHGDIAALQFGILPVSDAALDAFARAITLLVEAGLDRDLAARSTERLSLYVTADAYEQWEFRRRQTLTDAATVALQRSPLLAEALRGTSGLGDPFSFGLELILDGIAAQASR